MHPMTMHRCSLKMILTAPVTVRNLKECAIKTKSTLKFGTGHCRQILFDFGAPEPHTLDMRLFSHCEVPGWSEKNDDDTVFDPSSKGVLEWQKLCVLCRSVGPGAPSLDVDTLRAVFDTMAAMFRGRPVVIANRSCFGGGPCEPQLNDPAADCDDYWGFDVTEATLKYTTPNPVQPDVESARLIECWHCKQPRPACWYPGQNNEIRDAFIGFNRVCSTLARIVIRKERTACQECVTTLTVKRVEDCA
jgi:hypothetical protein